MLSLAEQRFQVDRSRVIVQRFEDEAVLVNMESGYYYSMSQSGFEVLGLLEEGHGAGELAGLLFAEAADAERFGPTIEGFVEELVREAVLTPRDAAASVPAEGEAHVPVYAAGAAYETPILQRYEDMRELLLIDPVHQVDRAHGWPKKPETEPSIDA